VSDPDERRGIGGRAGIVLAIVCSAQLILAVDITIILVADVQVKHALGFSEASLSWIVTAYALTFGGLLLLAGRLSDSFGHRRMFLVGTPGADGKRNRKLAAGPAGQLRRQANAACGQVILAAGGVSGAQLRGMPRTSSPMTLSCISSVPPPMSVGGTDR
jgi:MFS family permease